MWIDLKSETAILTRSAEVVYNGEWLGELP